MFPLSRLIHMSGDTGPKGSAPYTTPSSRDVNQNCRACSGSGTKKYSSDLDEADSLRCFGSLPGLMPPAVLRDGFRVQRHAEAGCLRDPYTSIALDREGFPRGSPAQRRVAERVLQDLFFLLPRQKVQIGGDFEHSRSLLDGIAGRISRISSARGRHVPS